MKQTGSTSWSNLQSLLTSKLEVEIKLKDETQVVTLSEVGRFLRDENQEVRKAAFTSMLDAYQKVEDSIALSLSSIKGEVNFVSKLRGYQSALEESLEISRTNEETLNAMLKAVYEYLPYFHNYLKRKAKLLGHEKVYHYTTY